MNSQEHQDKTAQIESTDWWNGLTDAEKVFTLAKNGKKIPAIEKELTLKIDGWKTPELVEAYRNGRTKLVMAGLCPIRTEGR